MTKLYQDMTLDEKTKYWEMFNQTCDTLRFAIIDLKVAAAGAEVSSAASAILAEELRLQSELALLENHKTAVIGNATAATPPSADDVDKVTALAREVDILTVNSETFGSVLILAKNALDAYGKVRGG